MLTSHLSLQRDFHAHHISFLPLATKDKDGRVWASLLAGEEGQPGFISAPSPRSLQINASTWPGDPIARTLAHGEKNQLVAGVGVELSSRRRNKLAGHAEALWSGNKLKLDIDIDEALGYVLWLPDLITITLNSTSVAETARSTSPSVTSFLTPRRIPRSSSPAPR